MARVLITGGAGYVGSHAAKRLARAGHACVVLDNLSRGHREFVRWGELVEGDIRDRERLRLVFARHRFDAVLHFAALAYVGELMLEPKRYADVNVRGTETLLAAMAEAGVARLVFSSSCAVYGDPGGERIDEAVAPAPINPYGETKLACERLIEAAGIRAGLRAVRLRYFNAAGADPEGDLGEDHTPETHLVPLVLDAAMGRRPDVTIFGNEYETPDGTAIRDFVHVSDLAEAHALALDHLLDGGAGTALNLGTGDGVSVGGMIETAERVTRRPVPVVLAAPRPGDPARLVADAGRARSVLGWRPHRSDPETMLADAWSWHRRRFGGGGT